MASVLPSVIDEALFQCRLCCRSAADPRLLPCLHVFCRICLLRHVARLRDAAAAQCQSRVAQDEPEDQASLEPSTTAVSQRDPGVEEGLPASTDGQPSVAMRVSAVPANSPLSVGHDEFEYEVPWNYEDVDNGQAYCNDVMVSASHVVTTSQGYAVMTSAASSSPQVCKLCTKHHVHLFKF